MRLPADALAVAAVIIGVVAAAAVMTMAAVVLWAARGGRLLDRKDGEG